MITLLTNIVVLVLLGAAALPLAGSLKASYRLYKTKDDSVSAEALCSMISSRSIRLDSYGSNLTNLVMPQGLGIPSLKIESTHSYDHYGMLALRELGSGRIVPMSQKSLKQLYLACAMKKDFTPEELAALKNNVMQAPMHLDVARLQSLMQQQQRPRS